MPDSPEQSGDDSRQPGDDKLGDRETPLTADDGRDKTEIPTLPPTQDESGWAAQTKSEVLPPPIDPAFEAFWAKCFDLKNADGAKAPSIASESKEESPEVTFEPLAESERISFVEFLDPAVEICENDDLIDDAVMAIREFIAAFRAKRIGFLPLLLELADYQPRSPKYNYQLAADDSEVEMQRKAICFAIFHQFTSILLEYLEGKRHFKMGEQESKQLLELLAVRKVGVVGNRSENGSINPETIAYFQDIKARLEEYSQSKDADTITLSEVYLADLRNNNPLPLMQF